MNIIRSFALAVAALGAAAVFTPALAQEDDVFAFIPDGGRTLLQIAVEGAPADEVHNNLSTCVPLASMS